MCGPQPGEEIAGFRVIMELGRGAFAGVYLAEELNLGRRLVAIKVSRPDGEEPRILARLQHAHIVPVHSVCDDPASGLRVLCMPYFGGADLAKVLRAAGGLLPTRHDGRSLVKALDKISHRVPERQAVSSTHRALDPPRSLVADGAIPISLIGVAFSRPLGSDWEGGGAASPPGPDKPAEVPDEPARRFLKQAALSRPPHGSSRGSPRDSSTPTPGVCSIVI